MSAESVALRFRTDATPASIARYGNGHINETYLLVTGSGRQYILQRVNHQVFADVPALMRNIAAVTRHIAKKVDDPRQVLTLIPTQDGDDYLHADGEYWRMYDFVTDSLCLDQAETEDDFRQSGVAFGQFQNQLSDFPAATLSETIPRFHDTVNRYARFKEAIAADPCNRAKTVQPEIAFFLQREKAASQMLRLRDEGRLPLRVTHNDTKLNNVMLDHSTRLPLCVIDLDTVMPGLAGNDFGDSIRFGASTGKEDETDLGRVRLSLPLYTAYTQGFLSACGARLTPTEIETLPLGAKLMTLECGVRFLTDYLLGDTYFHIARPNHNVDRARTQIKLVSDMEKNWAAMQEIVLREAEKHE